MAKYKHEGISNRFISENGQVEYQMIHYWVIKQMGKAKTCELCGTLKSKRFHWALKRGFIYERKIENFFQLCTKCHRRYDKLEDHSNLAICKYDLNMNFLEEFKSVTEAAVSTNGNRASISCALTGRTKTSGGYIWKYKFGSVKRKCFNGYSSDFTYRGVTKNMTEWSLFLGGSRNLLQNRLKQGWDLKKALSIPARKNKNNIKRKK